MPTQTVFRCLLLFHIFGLRDCLEHGDRPQQHLVKGPIESNKILECPPDVVSSPEEVAHYCHKVRGQHFKLSRFGYECSGGEHSSCKGEINPELELPKCSQPSIASCEDETVYSNFNDWSKGPCLYRQHDMIWHSARCGDGHFSCWDPSMNQWCEGTVDDSSVSSENISCPPTYVYSRYEATHYCSQSGLTTLIDADDETKYACYKKDGTAVCSGSIDGRRPPSCSIRIHDCDAITKVCETGQKSFCDVSASAFECWDFNLDRWCVGQVYSHTRGANTMSMSATDDRVSSSENIVGASMNGEMAVQSKILSWFMFPGVLVIVLVLMTGLLLRENLSSDVQAKLDDQRNILSPTTDFGYYQPISDGMELTSILS